MKLNSNQKNNLQALAAIALHTHHSNIKIYGDIIENENNIENSITINFTRKMSINELKKLNDYFNTDIRNKSINYGLTIYFDNPENSVLYIEGIKNDQISMFSNEEIELTYTINHYNNSITNRLNKHLKLLINTFKEDEIKNWTFYYISKDNNHIGFPNKNDDIRESFKVFKSSYRFFENDEHAEFYQQVKSFIGTKNDAMCMCLRRNYNSECGGLWKVCLFETPINHLWHI